MRVKEPLGDSVLLRFSNDVLDGLAIFFREFSGSGVGVNSSDLKDNMGESSSDTLDFSETEGNFLFSIDVGVEETDDVSEVGGFLKD